MEQTRPIVATREELILGAAMAYLDHAYTVVMHSGPHDYHEPAAQRLFAAITTRTMAGEISDPAAVWEEEVEGDPAITAAGGLDWLANLALAGEAVCGDVLSDLMEGAGVTTCRAMH